VSHDPLGLLLAALIVAGAAAVKGTIGFGFPLIAVPLLSTILGPRIAVPVVAIPTLLSNVFLISRGGFSRATASLAMVLAGITLGTLVGAMLITILEPRVLSVLVGAVALLYVLAAAFRLTVMIPPAAGMSAAPAVGILAGVMGGLTGISSPLLASYLHLLRVDKREFVFWITIMFFVGNVVQVASYAGLGLYAGPVLSASLLACLPMAAGTLSGIALQDRLHPATFSRVVLAIVFLASLNLLARSLR
jgi:uncharacterized membrane protein YfcA